MINHKQFSKQFIFKTTHHILEVLKTSSQFQVSIHLYNDITNQKTEFDLIITIFCRHFLRDGPKSEQFVHKYL